MDLIFKTYLICLILSQVTSSPPVARKVEYLLNENRRNHLIAFRSNEIMTVVLKRDTDYYDINTSKSVYCVFYVKENNSDGQQYTGQYGILLQWEDFYSDSCFRIDPKNNRGPKATVCKDKVKLKTVDNIPTGLVNISYSGTPYTDRFMLSMVAYKKVSKQKQCEEGFEKCLDSNGTRICISRLVCSEISSCRMEGQCGVEATEKPGYKLPLGFIGAISGLITTAVLFSIILFIWWYKCRRRSEPSEVDRSATEHLNTESNRPRVQPNEYAVFNTQGQPSRDVAKVS